MLLDQMLLDESVQDEMLLSLYIYPIMNTIQLFFAKYSSLGQILMEIKFDKVYIECFKKQAINIKGICILNGKV